MTPPAQHHPVGLARRRTLLRASGPIRRRLAPAAAWAAFAVANAFWARLLSDRWVDFTPAAYARDLGLPLQETFLEPMSVLTHPWMILVHGLALGGAILVPLMVTVVHRLWVAAAMVLLVALVGHAPVLAGALMLGCVLVTQTPLRREVPLLAMLLGMVPVGIYLILAGFTGTGVEAVLPIQRWALRAPLVLAAVAAVVGAAAVLAAGQAAGFRPTPVWCALVVPLAAAPAIFYTAVGPGELAYQRIAHRLHLPQELFAPVSVSAWRQRAAAEGLGEAGLVNLAVDDLGRRRRRLVDRCDAFLRQYPAHRRAKEVSWLAAQALCLRLDRRTYERGVVRATAHRPSQESAPRWRRLADAHPGTAHAGLALWRLGELALRQRRAEAAEQLLEAAITTLRQAADANAQAAPRTAVFDPPASLPPPTYYPRAAARAGHLLWLSEQNGAARDPNAAAALGALLATDPRLVGTARHFRQLKRLAGAYEGTALGDNLKLCVALANPHPSRRLEQLLILAGQRTDMDAAVRANYELGLMVLRRPALSDRDDVKTAAEYFRAVRAAPPNPWTALAAEPVPRPPPTTRANEARR
jgi:hypothetical protein